MSFWIPNALELGYTQITEKNYLKVLTDRYYKNCSEKVKMVTAAPIDPIEAGQEILISLLWLTSSRQYKKIVIIAACMNEPHKSTFSLCLDVTGVRLMF